MLQHRPFSDFEIRWIDVALAQNDAIALCAHASVRATFFCIIDTLTSASMRPGVDGNIEELPGNSRLYRSRPQRQYVTNAQSKH